MPNAYDDKDGELDYAAWIEIIDEQHGLGRQWMAPRSFIDSMAQVEEIDFRKQQLKRRAEEFTQRAIFAFYINAEEPTR
jgi:hypothetical protein